MTGQPAQGMFIMSSLVCVSSPSFCFWRDWGTSHQAGETVLCLGSVLISPWHIYLLEVRMNILLLRMLISPKISSMTFHN